MASLDKQATNRLHTIFTAQISGLLGIDIFDYFFGQLVTLYIANFSSFSIIFGKQYDLDEGDEGDKGNLKQRT